MATDDYSFIWQRTEMSALDSFLQYLLFCERCRSSETKAVLSLYSIHIHLYTSTSPVNPHSFDLSVSWKNCEAFKSATSGMSAPPLWIHQQQKFGHQHNLSRLLILFSLFFPFSTVWPAPPLAQIFDQQT